MATLSQRILSFCGFRKSIAERLLEACASVPLILKQGRNGEYSYLRILDVANALRTELSSRGLIIIPNDIDCWRQSFETTLPDRWLSEVRVKTEFVVTDGRTRLKFFSYGSGSDFDGKALAIAQTAALKSWLKRLGLIFGELDDPEVETSHGIMAARFPREAERLASYQQRSWAAAMSTCGLKKEQVEAHLSEALGFPVKTEEITSLSSEQFDQAIRLITNSDLIESMSVSARTAGKRRKSQAITEAPEQAKTDELTGD